MIFFRSSKFARAHHTIKFLYAGGGEAHSRMEQKINIMMVPVVNISKGEALFFHSKVHTPWKQLFNEQQQIFFLI
jgi:hypothetical protein